MRQLRFAFFVVFVSGVVIALGVVAGLSLRNYRAALDLRTSLSSIAPDARPVNSQVIKDLNARAAANLLKPGWVHLVTEMFNDTQGGSGGVLEDGTLIPLNYVRDEWYHLNSEQLVFESVSLMQTTDGRVIEVAVFKEGVLRNLTLKKALGTLNPYPLILDYGFAQNVELMEKAGSGAFQAPASLNAADVTLFVVLEAATDTIPITGSDSPPTQTEIRAYYDPTTGRLLQKDTVVQLADGMERVIERSKLNTLEWVESPPGNVLDYLNQAMGN